MLLGTHQADTGLQFEGGWSLMLPEAGGDAIESLL
jgi:hypothetical protein